MKSKKGRADLMGISIAVIAIVLVAVAGSYFYFQFDRSRELRQYQDSQVGTSSLINYQNSQLTISSLSPDSGSIGASVIIRGSGFNPLHNSIKFGLYSIGDFQSADGETLTFTVPSTLSSCTSQFCTAFIYHVDLGSFPITVSNEKGSSNAAIFNVTGGVTQFQ